MYIFILCNENKESVIPKNNGVDYFLVCDKGKKYPVSKNNILLNNTFFS